jgi:LysR family pca operon transcriptional activator
LASDPDIKFRHLQTFVEVARQKSVMRAAEILHVSQPAVTRTIRELEAALGVAVIERDGRGIRVTQFGDVFLRHAGASLTALRQGVDSVSQERLGQIRPIRVGALPTVSSRIMPRAMVLFLKQAIGSKVRIVTGETATLLEQLRRDELDLVVGRLAAPEKMAGFSFEHLYSEPVVFVVRAGHPILSADIPRFDNLQDFPVLMPNQSSIIRPIIDRFLIAHGVAGLPVQIETVSDSFARAFTRMSDAVWIISEGVIAADLAEGSLVALPFDTAETKGPVGLTMRTDVLPSLPLSLMMAAIRETSATVGTALA